MGTYCTNTHYAPYVSTYTGEIVSVSRQGCDGGMYFLYNQAELQVYRYGAWSIVRSTPAQNWNAVGNQAAALGASGWRGQGLWFRTVSRSYHCKNASTCSAWDVKVSRALPL